MKSNTKGRNIRRADETDLLDHLPPEIAGAVDRIGYELLKKHGYDIIDAEKSERKQRQLMRELRKRGQCLEYSLQSTKGGFIVLHFMLKEGDKVIDQSQGVKFMPGGLKREGNT